MEKILVYYCFMTFPFNRQMRLLTHKIVYYSVRTGSRHHFLWCQRCHEIRYYRQIQRCWGLATLGNARMQPSQWHRWIHFPTAYYQKHNASFVRQRLVPIVAAVVRKRSDHTKQRTWLPIHAIRKSVCICWKQSRQHVLLSTRTTMRTSRNVQCVSMPIR